MDDERLNLAVTACLMLIVALVFGVVGVLVIRGLLEHDDAGGETPHGPDGRVPVVLVDGDAPDGVVGDEVAVGEGESANA